MCLSFSVFAYKHLHLHFVLVSKRILRGIDVSISGRLKFWNIGLTLDRVVLLQAMQTFEPLKPVRSFFLLLYMWEQGMPFFQHVHPSFTRKFGHFKKACSVRALSSQVALCSLDHKHVNVLRLEQTGWTWSLH